MIYIYGILQHINLAHHALKTQVACFNHGMVILVAAKLKRQRLLSERFYVIAESDQRDTYTLIIL